MAYQTRQHKARKQQVEGSQAGVSHELQWLRKLKLLGLKAPAPLQRKADQQPGTKAHGVCSAQAQVQAGMQQQKAGKLRGKGC